MLAALRNVRASHLLDAGLWKKLGLPVLGDAPAEERATEATIPLARLTANAT
jgi:hypothetical protein